MMSMSPLATVQAAYEAFARRDVPAIFRLFSPDIEIVQSAELPWGGTYRGHAGAREFLTQLTAHLNSTMEFERFLESGDHVVVLGWTKGTVNATGATYRVPISHVWKVRDGRVAQIQFFIDNPTMLAALSAGRRDDRAETD